MRHGHAVLYTYRNTQKGIRRTAEEARICTIQCPREKKPRKRCEEMDGVRAMMGRTDGRESMLQRCVRVRVRSFFARLRGGWVSRDSADAGKRGAHGSHHEEVAVGGRACRGLRDLRAGPRVSARGGQARGGAGAHGAGRRVVRGAGAVARRRGAALERLLQLCGRERGGGARAARRTLAWLASLDAPSPP